MSTQFSSAQTLFTVLHVLRKLHYLIPEDAAKSGLGWVQLWKDGSGGRICEKTLEVPQAKYTKTA
jgi:hypothetical protein